jgi:hypothetical protein
MSRNPGSDLRAAAKAQLISDLIDMALRRPFGDEEALGDLATGQAFSNQPGNFRLSPR